MNIIATLYANERLNYEKVRYYSVVLDDANECEFYDFLRRMDKIPERIHELQNITEWIDLIGNKYSAQSRFFRPERMALALPPPRKVIKGLGPEPGEMRLYCLQLSESVVILFNGGIKTTIEANECPNVGNYFRMADKLAREILKMIRDKEIILDYKNLKYHEDTEIIIGG